MQCNKWFWEFPSQRVQFLRTSGGLVPQFGLRWSWRNETFLWGKFQLSRLPMTFPIALSLASEEAHLQGSRQHFNILHTDSDSVNAFYRDCSRNRAVFRTRSFCKGRSLPMLTPWWHRPVRTFRENAMRPLTIPGAMHNAETSGGLKGRWNTGDKAQLSATLLGRSPELGFWAFTERRLPTINEAFLPLDIRTATAVIERLSLACNGKVWERRGRFLTVGKQQLASVDSRQMTPS